MLSLSPATRIFVALEPVDIACGFQPPLHLGAKCVGGGSNLRPLVCFSQSAQKPFKNFDV